jgi:uncharacterized protein YndB with AHSA1/START domain
MQSEQNVTREVHVDASPEEVWEALATEEGRERWLDDTDREREIHVESAHAPHRLVWWWGGPEEPYTRVDLRIIASPVGTRVVVTESAPAHAFPLASLVACLSLVCA